MPLMKMVWECPSWRFHGCPHEDGVGVSHMNLVSHEDSAGVSLMIDFVGVLMKMVCYDSSVCLIKMMCECISWIWLVSIPKRLCMSMPHEAGMCTSHEYGLLASQDDVWVCRMKMVCVCLSWILLVSISRRWCMSVPQADCVRVCLVSIACQYLKMVYESASGRLCASANGGGVRFLTVNKIRLKHFVLLLLCVCVHNWSVPLWKQYKLQIWSSWRDIIFWKWKAPWNLTPENGHAHGEYFQCFHSRTWQIKTLPQSPICTEEILLYTVHIKSIISKFCFWS